MNGRERWPILVVDDEEVMRTSLSAWLAEDGYAVQSASSGREAVERVRGRHFAVCFVDLKMPPGIDGIETMRQIHALRAETSVVIVTAFATVDTAVAAMREGAADYVVKPCDPDEISLLLRRLMKVKQLERENVLLRKRLARQYTFQDIVSKNARMQEIFELIRQVASLRTTVLVEGASGTGKELIARAIHAAGGRASGPFVPVSCGAMVETLLESELFGHEKGSFTGATALKKGKLELADGGTLFLDEVGDISARLQVELLRALQERRFFRVGGTREIAVDVRVIAATNADLGAAVREGRFREDLFYRLNVIRIRVPALRERREDIPLLCEHLIARFSLELRKEVDGVAESGLALLMSHDWPGNVRELENAIERAVVTTTHRVLDASDFAFVREEAEGMHRWRPPGDLPLREVERQVIAATVERCGGNVQRAAAILGIDRSTLYDKLKRYGITRD